MLIKPLLFLEAPMLNPDCHKYDRRNGIERRYISYTFHVPERRSRDVRRSFKDQRIAWKMREKKIA
jgi:hypothetical protein